MTTPRARWLRIGIALALIVALLIVGEVTGLRQRITLDAIRDIVHRAGPWGVVLYAVCFVGLELLHAPGMLFFVAAVLIWGPVRGGLIGAVTALVSVCVTFGIVRAIGGKPTLPEKPALVRRLFERLQQHPVATVAALRLVTFMMPVVTYALALSPLRFADMLLGTTIGLVPAFVLGSVFGERALVWIGQLVHWVHQLFA